MGGVGLVAPGFDLRTVHGSHRRPSVSSSVRPTITASEDVFLVRHVSATSSSCSLQQLYGTPVRPCLGFGRSHLLWTFTGVSTKRVCIQDFTNLPCHTFIFSPAFFAMFRALGPKQRISNDFGRVWSGIETLAIAHAAGELTHVDNSEFLSLWTTNASESTGTLGNERSTVLFRCLADSSLPVRYPGVFKISSSAVNKADTTNFFQIH